MTPMMTKTVDFTIDITEMDNAQVRLIKRINSIVCNMMVTDDESEYFELSSELLKLTGQSIKDANFSKFWSESSNIPYADQALEFGVDALSEELSTQLVPQDN